VKILPHRLRDGRCRDCGMHDTYAAPDSCPRCALERMRERGYPIVREPVVQFLVMGDEMWRRAAEGIKTGTIKSDRFYVMIGHNDGGTLLPPIGELVPNNGEMSSAKAAHLVAASLTQRYPQAWVVTTVGCWNAVRRDEQEDR
jgi:hypothetical protein